MDYLQKTEQYCDLTNRRLAEIIVNVSAHDRIKKAIEYTLFPGGKRLRPCLALACCDMFGGNLFDALPFACSIEMIHTYSLIHDDLPCMDDSDLRRGKPSCHIAFGEDIAVLTGDALLNLAYETLFAACASNGENVKAASVIALSAGLSGMIGGQVLDLTNESGGEKCAETLYETHSKKTGALIEASLLCGALSGGASASEIESIKNFAGHYGVLFQITDDILDISGNQEVFGKPTGADSDAGKLTFPAMFGFERSKELAEETAKNAHMSISGLNKDISYFVQLIDITLNREK